MNQKDYQENLTNILEQNTSTTIHRFAQILDLTPEKSQELTIDIICGQDGEGDFCVQAGFNGPDLYVLNKPIEDIAALFEVVHGPEGFEPAVPMVNSYDSEFNINDTIVDTVAHWLQTLWEQMKRDTYHLDIIVQGHDDFGTITPLYLHDTEG